MTRNEVHQKLVISTSQALLSNMTIRDAEKYPDDFLNIVKNLVPKLVEIAMSESYNHIKTQEFHQING